MVISYNNYISPFVGYIRCIQTLTNVVVHITFIQACYGLLSACTDIGADMSEAEHALV